MSDKQRDEPLEALARLQGSRRNSVPRSADRDYNTIREHFDALREENMRLMQWVHDLQSGMYINCVYCGHRYGPEDEVPATMADALKEHIEQCPEHPMSELRRDVDVLVEALEESNKQLIMEENKMQLGIPWTDNGRKVRLPDITRRINDNGAIITRIRGAAPTPGRVT